MPLTDVALQQQQQLRRIFLIFGKDAMDEYRKCLLWLRVR